MLKQLQNGQEQPFFITKEAEAEMVATGYEFELPPVAYMMRLRDMMEGMSDAGLVFSRVKSPTKSASTGRTSHFQPTKLSMVFFVALLNLSF